MEAALQIKDKDPSTRITVISMGPKKAESILRDCIAMGIDNAYLISDTAFQGSDTLATSYILSQSIKKIEEMQNCSSDLI